MAKVNSKQASYWISKLRQNLLEHCLNEDKTDEEKIDFISTQYTQLSMINLAIRGKVFFTGAPQPE